LPFQRAEDPAAALAGGNEEEEEDEEEDGPKTLAAKLKWLSAETHGQDARATTSPVEDVVQAHTAALAQAFRGALAPVRQVMLNSTSKQDAEHKLKALFADWPTERIAGIVEQAMQICAAKGAVQGMRNNE